jgi:hypothetical protein
LREAARVVRQSDDNDTLAVTKAEAGQVTVRSAGSLAASKNAKLDHQLTFSEFMYAKNLFLTAIDNAKWGDDTTDSFNWFFHNLDNHPMREEGDRGERALLFYASRARLDWHDKLTLRKAYNIGTINEDLLAKIARELDSREVQTNLEQVRFPAREPYKTNRLSTASSCLTTTQPHDPFDTTAAAFAVTADHDAATTASAATTAAAAIAATPHRCYLLTLPRTQRCGFPHPPSWIKPAPTVFSQRTVGDISHETCAAGDPHGPLPPAPQDQ